MLTFVDVGAAQVVDDDVVGAAERVEVDALDVVEVHRARWRCRGRSSARPPLAEMSMFSATLAPLNSIVSVPSWPSSVSLSSPGFQTKVSSPAPISAVSLPSPPLIRSSPSLPMNRSCAEAAVDRQLDAVGLQAAGVDDVVAAQPVERQPVVRRPWKNDVHLRLQAEHVDAAGIARDAEDVVAAACALTVTRVRRAVAAAVRAAQVEVDLRHVGPAQVADHDVVGAAERVEVDALDVVQVHRRRWRRCG